MIGYGVQRKRKGEGEDKKVRGTRGKDTRSKEKKLKRRKGNKRIKEKKER